MISRQIALTIVMPTYNEENRLASTLNTFAQWIKQNFDLKIELIIVDDGSTDKTEAIVQSYINKYDWIRLIKEKHVGMMNAIISGIKLAKYDIIGTFEADSPVHPRYFNFFLKYIIKYDLVIGSRFLGKEVIGKSLVRRFISKANSILFNTLFSCPIKDPQISFRLYKKISIQKILPMLCLKHDGFKSSEILVKAYSLGFQLKELPIDYAHNRDSKAVPGGIKTIRVTIFAIFALFQLWFQSIKEYRDGILPYCPVNSKIIIDYVIGK